MDRSIDPVVTDLLDDIEIIIMVIGIADRSNVD